MAEYYPSEIARLVLGYLKEANCPKAWETFLVESVDLQEHYRLLQSGRSCATNIEGKSLTDILREYCFFKDAAKRNTRNEIIPSLSCTDRKSSIINVNASSIESSKTLKENIGRASYNSKIHQTTQSQTTVRFSQGRNQSPWSMQTHLFTSTQSHLSRRPHHLKRICVRALNFDTGAEGNEKPISVHSGDSTSFPRRSCAKLSVMEANTDKRFCHSNHLERKPTVLSRMVQTETSQLTVDNTSCPAASNLSPHERLLENSSTECTPLLSTDMNFTYFSTKNQSQSNAESRNSSTDCTPLLSTNVDSTNSSTKHQLQSKAEPRNSSTENTHSLSTNVNSSAKNQFQSNTESQNFSNKSDMEEKLDNSRSSFTENKTAPNSDVVNQTTICSSTEIQTIGSSKSPSKPQFDAEPHVNSLASRSNSSSLIPSCNQTQVSLTTPKKDKRRCTEKSATTSRKGTIPKRLSESPHSKQINLEGNSFATVHDNLESVFEEDVSKQSFTQRFADITTVIVEDPGASNSSSFPTMQDIHNSDLVMQNILAREESVSLFSDLFPLCGNSKDCESLNTQESPFTTSKETLLITEDIETDKAECEQVDNKTAKSESDTDSSKQHDTAQKNEAHPQLSPSSQGIPHKSESAMEQNTPTAANIQIPVPMEVVRDRTNMTQVSSFDDVSGSCMSTFQPDTKTQFQICNFGQNKDQGDNAIEGESMTSNINENSSLVSASITASLSGIDDSSTLKPVSIGTPFQVTQIGPQATYNSNIGIPTTETIFCSSSTTNGTKSFIPSNRNVPIPPAIQGQRLTLNSNFQISPLSQFSYPLTSGFPLQPPGFQSGIILIQQPYPSNSINNANCKNSLKNDNSMPVKTVLSENIDPSSIVNSSSMKLPHHIPPKSLPTNDVNISTVAPEISRLKKKSKNSLCKEKRRKPSKKKSTHLKKKQSCKSLCSPLKSSENVYGEKKRYRKYMTKEKEDVATDFVTNTIKKLTANKSVPSSISDAVLNAIQGSLQSKPIKRQKEDSLDVCNLFHETDISVSPIKKSPLNLESDSSSDNLPLSVIASKLKIKENESFDHLQNNLLKSNLVKETDKNGEETFFAMNTSSIKSSASDRIKSKISNHIQQETSEESKKLRNVKSTQSYNISEVSGNSPSNPIILGSDEDVEMPEIENENAASHVMCNTKSKSSKKEQKKKYTRKKQLPKLNSSSKEKTVSHKNSKGKNSFVSKISHLPKTCETVFNPLQIENSNSPTEKGDYKTSQERCTKAETLCNKRSKTKGLHPSRVLKKKTNIDENNIHSLSNEETDFSSSEHKYRTSQNFAKKKKQENILKVKFHLSSSQNTPELSHLSSFKKVQNSLGAIKNRNIDELGDKLRLNAAQNSPRKEKTLNPLTEVDKFPGTLVRNSFEESNNETPLQQEPLQSEIVVSVNPVENEGSKPASVEILDENSISNPEVINNIGPHFITDINSNQSSIGDQPDKPNIKRYVLPPKKRIRSISISSFCFDSSSLPPDVTSITRNLPDLEVSKIVSFPPKLDSPAHSVCFNIATRPEEMPCLTENTSIAEINEIVSSPPKLNSPAKTVCFESPSKPKEMPSLSPIDVDNVKKDSAGKPKASIEFFRGPLSDLESNLPISLNSEPSFLSMAETLLCRNKHLPASTLKTSLNKENLPVNKVSPEKKKTAKGQKRKLSSLKNSSDKILLSSSCSSSRLTLKKKKSNSRMKNSSGPQIPDGVKIPTNWNNSAIKSYSSAISITKDELGSKVRRRNRPNIKVAPFNFSSKKYSFFKRKVEKETSFEFSKAD